MMDSYRRVGVYTAPFLKVEKPADLPVQQSQRSNLRSNVRATNLLGITVPATLLARADAVIE